MIQAKRVYDPPSPSDGFRILVDRLWPRGVSKGRAALGLWMKDVGPSDELRKWFGHDPKKWSGFRKRYFRELAGKAELLGTILSRARKGTVTLLYGARDERFNNAVALKEYIEHKVVDAD